MNTPQLKEKLITLMEDATDEQLDVALSILDKRKIDFTRNDLNEFKRIGDDLESGHDNGFSYGEVMRNALQKIQKNDL